MTTKATEADRVQGSQVRIEMLRRGGLTNADLAKMTGLSTSTVKSIKAGMPRQRGRAAIERALGIPIWSDAEQYAFRDLILSRFGVDPALVSRPRLRSLASENALPGRASCKTRDELITLLLRHATKPMPPGEGSAG